MALCERAGRLTFREVALLGCKNDCRARAARSSIAGSTRGSHEKIAGARRARRAAVAWPRKLLLVLIEGRVVTWRRSRDANRASAFQRETALGGPRAGGRCSFQRRWLQAMATRLPASVSYSEPRTLSKLTRECPPSRQLQQSQGLHRVARADGSAAEADAGAFAVMAAFVERDAMAQVSSPDSRNPEMESRAARFVPASKPRLPPQPRDSPRFRGSYSRRSITRRWRLRSAANCSNPEDRRNAHSSGASSLPSALARP